MTWHMTSFIQNIPEENRALCACDQGGFSPDMFLWPQVLEMGGRKDGSHLPDYTWEQRNEASAEYRAWLKAPKPWQKLWHRGNARVGSAQMARKGTRAGCQRLSSNLSLLGPHTPPRCQQNGLMQTTGAHKVGDGSLSQRSFGARQGYLTNANPPLFSCTWGGLSMQRVRIQILCAQTQPLPFEILALSASGFCYNAWTLGLRGSEGGESLSVVPWSPRRFPQGRKKLIG